MVKLNKDATDQYEVTHKAKALVLSCIDYRFIDHTTNLLQLGPLNMKYDFTALPGSSLSFNQRKFKCWRTTFLETVKLAIQLHHIGEIVVIDHMDCGAYALLYPHIKMNSEEEKNLHIKNINKFIKRMRKFFPKLKYTGYLLDIDGKVEQIII